MLNRRQTRSSKRHNSKRKTAIATSGFMLWVYLLKLRLLCEFIWFYPQVQVFKNWNKFCIQHLFAFWSQFIFIKFFYSWKKPFICTQRLSCVVAYFSMEIFYFFQILYYICMYNVYVLLDTLNSKLAFFFCFFDFCSNMEKHRKGLFFLAVKICM